MADSIYKWSLTPSANDAADAAINWRENQLPDTVNDSNRAMMARIAEWREDMTGGIVTTGTQPAYLLATRAAFDALADGRWFTCRVHATNAAGAATLNVNGLGAKAIRKFGVTGDLPIAAGDLQLGGLYQFMYSASANTGAGGWVISNPSAGPNGLTMPAGTAMLFIQATAPSGWTKLTTHDDKALRIVSGTGGGAGGTVAFTAAFTARSGGVGDTTLTVAQMPAHAHTQQGTFGSGTVSSDHSHSFNINTGTVSNWHQHAYTAPTNEGTDTRGTNTGSVWNIRNAVSYNTGTDSANHWHNAAGGTGGISANHTHSTTISGATTNTGSGTAHTHTWAGDFSVQYVDAIICTKD